MAQNSIYILWKTKEYTTLRFHFFPTLLIYTVTYETELEQSTSYEPVYCQEQTNM